MTETQRKVLQRLVDFNCDMTWWQLTRPLPGIGLRTVDGLVRRGWIAKVPRGDLWPTFYEITDVGRAALARARVKADALRAAAVAAKLGVTVDG